MSSQGTGQGYCRNCQAPNSTHNQCCSVCGARLPWATDDATPPAPSAQSSSAAPAREATSAELMQRVQAQIEADKERAQEREDAIARARYNLIVGASITAAVLLSLVITYGLVLMALAKAGH